MSTEFSDVEALLRSALVPIEPSERMTDRLERSLTEITDMAAEELADWELGAMRDPRNWGRPAAALVVGGAAAGGLVLVRARQQARRRQGASLNALERSLRQVAADIQRRIDR
jgi:hypothetical protein